MVKKICVVFSMLALMPALAVAKPYKGGTDNRPGGSQTIPASFDRELYELEDLLDREAHQMMSRGNGADVAIGIIGAIADLASRHERGKGGKGGWHPGYGRQHRKYVCVAQNRKGQRFNAEGYVQARVADRAVRTCQHFSKDRRDRFDRVAKSCRVISCRASRY